MLKRILVVSASVLLIGSYAGAQDSQAPNAQGDDYGPGVSVRTQGGADASVTAEGSAEVTNEARENRPAEDRRADAAAKPNPRQVFYKGRWWYYTKDKQWLIYENGQWVPQHQAAPQQAQFQQPQPQYYQPQPQYYYDNGSYSYGGQPYYGNRYGSGYRGYNDGYYGGRGYYNDGYYGRGGYYNGPGYGNRGWGNMNYGSRGANQGSNIGGAIGQGLGGSGQLGAGIGAAIGNQ